MKTFIILAFALFWTTLFSCEKKSDSIKTDTLAVSKKGSIKTAEESITFLKSLNKIDILTKFFKPYKIINDTAIWEQDLESINMRVSDDGFIHTVVDSIYQLDDIYIIIFNTYLIMEDGQIESGHPSGIDYSIGTIKKDKNSGKYIITGFKKHLTSGGSFGYGLPGEIVDLKNKLKAIKITGGWTGTGAIMENEDYFNIEDFSNLLHIETYNSNEGLCEEDDFKCIDKTEREVIPFDKHPSNKPAIIIKYKHTYYDEQVIIIEKSDTLIYDGYHFNKDVYYEGV